MKGGVGGIDSKRRPDETETEDLCLWNRFVKHENRQKKHGARRQVLQKSEGRQGQSPGAQVEKKQETQNKKQMVDAEQDMVDSHVDIRSGHPVPGWAPWNGKSWAVGF